MKGNERDPRELTPTSKELESVLDETLPGGGQTEARNAFLLVIAGEHPGRVFPLDRPERVIGRAKNADIRIDQGSISSSHAKVVTSDGAHRLVDMGSTNGTYVNDRRVSGEVGLQGGDVIRVGETVMSYLLPREGGDLPTVAIQHVPMDARAIAALPPAGGLGRAAMSSHPDILVRNVDEGMSLRDLIGRVLQIYWFLHRHRRAFLVFALFGSALGGISAFAFPPPGTAEFEVRLTPKTATNPVQTFQNSNVEFFASAETNFRSPDLIRQTLGALGDAHPNDDRVRRARDKLRFETTGLLTYRGTYTDTTAERALSFLDRHVKSYLDTEIDKTLKVIHTEVDFLRGQLSQNETELSRTERALRDFKQSHIDGLPEQAREQFSARLALKSRQTALASEAERAALELGSVRQRLSQQEPLAEHRVASSQPYRQALTEVNRKLGEARASGLGEAHPDVIRLKNQVDELTRLSQQALNTDATDLERRADPTLKAMKDRLADLEVQRRSAAKELGRVSGDLAALDKVVRDLPEVEAKYAELTRSYDATKDLHTKLFERYKAAELQLELERASAAARYEILTPPSAQKPSLRQAALLRITLGALVGLAGAVLVALGIELRRYMKENMQ